MPGARLWSRLLILILSLTTFACICLPVSTVPSTPTATACEDRLMRLLSEAEGLEPPHRQYGYDSSFPLEDEYELVTYRVFGDKLVTSEVPTVPDDLLNYQQDTDFHNQIWALFAAMIPTEQRRMVAEFVVFTDGEDNLWAAVDQFDTDPEAWQLEVDILDAQDQNVLVDALIHEFGHLLTLNGSQMSTEKSCPQLMVDGSCSLPESYLNLFYERFWVDLYDEWQEIDRIGDDSVYEEQIADFYDRYQDQFVTAYAATGPSEDIAESWMFFILRPRPDGDTIAEQKILFFYQWPELVQLRLLITSRMCEQLAAH